MNEVSQLIRNLEEAQTVDDVRNAIDALAQRGEPVIAALLQTVRSVPLRPARQKTVMQVLEKMGYPANSSALVFMVDVAANANSPGWDSALVMLKEIGEPALVEVHNSLYFYSQDPDEYRFEIQSLCTLLEQMAPSLVESLLPDLLYLLEIGTDINNVDECVLGPLRKIGSPKADEAIPLFHKKILSERTARLKVSVIETLLDFDPSAIQPLVPVLRECLSAESEAVRASVVKVLTALGVAL